MTIISTIRAIGAAVAIVGYRLRGSAGKGGWVEKLFGMPVGTFLGRFFWCVPFAWMASDNWAQFFVATPLAYVGVMFGYFGGRFDLSKPENRNWINYIALTARGAFIPLPVCLLVQHGWLSIVGGALFVPCYLLGMRTVKLWRPALLKGHTEHGEFWLASAIITGMNL